MFIACCWCYCRTFHSVHWHWTGCDVLRPLTSYCKGQVYIESYHRVSSYVTPCVFPESRIAADVLHCLSVPVKKIPTEISVITIQWQTVTYAVSLAAFWLVLTARRSNASAVFCVVILSVRLSVWHARPLWQNERTYCRYFDNTYRRAAIYVDFNINTGYVPCHLILAFKVTPTKNADSGRYTLITSPP